MLTPQSRSRLCPHPWRSCDPPRGLFSEMPSARSPQTGQRRPYGDKNSGGWNRPCDNVDATPTTCLRRIARLSLVCLYRPTWRPRPLSLRRSHQAQRPPKTFAPSRSTPTRRPAEAPSYSGPPDVAFFASAGRDGTRTDATARDRFDNRHDEECSLGVGVLGDRRHFSRRRARRSGRGDLGRHFSGRRSTRRTPPRADSTRLTEWREPHSCSYAATTSDSACAYLAGPSPGACANVQTRPQRTGRRELKREEISSSRL